MLSLFLLKISERILNIGNVAAKVLDRRHHLVEKISFDSLLIPVDVILEHGDCTVVAVISEADDSIDLVCHVSECMS